MKLKSAVWWITSRCNFDCAYCGIRPFLRKKEPKEPVSAERWIAAWNNLKPNILDFTGGEPFLAPDLAQIINGLDAKTQVAITTNGSGNLLDFVECVDIRRVRFMTVSYHLNSPLSQEDFLARCMLLKNAGVDLTINTVAYPAYIPQIAESRALFERWGFRFHVDTYMDESGGYNLSNEERNQLDGEIGNDRRYLLDSQTRPAEMPTRVLCSAGMDHLSVFPDGSAYRCLSDAIIGRKKKAGNILNPEFRLLAEMKPCEVSHSCSGCDHDKTKRTVYTEGK